MRIQILAKLVNLMLFSITDVVIKGFFLIYPCLVLAISQPPLYFSSKNNAQLNFETFPISSEIQIGKIYHLIDNTATGAYLTVGAERSFRAASMMPNITYLMQLDIAPEILRYNLINKELLKAPTRQQYLKLRWYSTFEIWQSFKEITDKNNKTIVRLTKDDFKWWQRHVRNTSNMNYQLPEYLNKHQKSPPCDNKDLSNTEQNINLAEILDYKTGNYLFNDRLYERLHLLAIQNRIFSSLINLKDQKQLNKLKKYLKNNKIQIGVLDLNNLYYFTYIGQEAYHHLLKELAPFGTKDTLLLAMGNYKDYACGQFQIYIGFTFEHMSQWSGHFRMQDFFDSIPPEVNDLINGRLYEGTQRLPSFVKSELSPPKT